MEKETVLQGAARREQTNLLTEPAYAVYAGNRKLEHVADERGEKAEQNEEQPSPGVKASPGDPAVAQFC